MAQTVYAVPGFTPQGQELTDKDAALRLAEANGTAVFAYRKEADGSLSLLGTKTRRGKVVKYAENPLKDFGFQAPPFHSELRRMGQTGRSVYRDLQTGMETKKPKTVYFDDADAALQALAVFLVLERVDTRGAEDITNGRDHQKMAAIRLPNGDIFSATLSPEQNDYWIQAPGINRIIRWGTWAREGQYPATKAAAKSNPRSKVRAERYKGESADFPEALRLMGQLGHTVYSSLLGRDGDVIYITPFATKDAMRALATYLTLEGADVSRAVDYFGPSLIHAKARVRLKNGDVFSAERVAGKADFLLKGPGVDAPILFSAWANTRGYKMMPSAKGATKSNPSRSSASNYGYWVHIRPDKTFAAAKTGPGRAKFRETAEQYLRSQGLNPAALQRGGYGADYSHGNERGAYYWDTPAGSNILAFWYDLDYISKTYKSS